MVLIDRSRRAVGAGAVLLLITGIVLPAAALADNEPNGAASCMGIEQAAISPPGSSDEEPGGSSQFVSEVKGLAAEQGVSPGALFSFVASLHEGSHEACDEALGGGDETTSAVRSSSGLGARALHSQIARAWPKVD
jgi:hypothetical protein